MRLIVFTIAIAISSSAFAQAARDCGGLWKAVDSDANGVLTKQEDVRGYIDAFHAAGRTSLAPEQLSRDEFMLFCEGNLERSSAETLQHKGANGPIDRGKGDLTPGLIPFPKDEAMKRLEASGYRDIGDLVLDGQGIWRTTAVFNGKRISVSVDVQGDVLAGG